MPTRVVASDHRIFYCVSGIAEISVGGTTFNLFCGYLLYIPAGMPYGAERTSPDFSAFAINFDFSNTASAMSAPVPPIREVKGVAPTLLEEAPPKEFLSPILLPDFPEGERYLRDIEHEYRHKKLYSKRRTSLLLSDLLILALRRDTRRVTPKFASLAEKVAAYLRQHYRETCDLKEIGDAFSYHPNYLNRLMVAYTGLSIHKYLIRYRIDRAVDLLSTTGLSVTEVGAAVGFSNLSHFSKVFERITGYPPSAFQA